MSYKNNKLAFIVPGQGSQYVNMAQDFIENDPILNEILKDFDNSHSVDLKEIMQNGPVEKLKETQFTQPAILFHSIAALKTFKKEFDIDPEFVAGHSLGEFSALVANNVLDLKDAMHLVHKRGQFMIKANQGKPFGMTAILGLSNEEVKELCSKVENKGIVVAANFNTPKQTVISGEKGAVDSVADSAKEKGAKRVVPLTVGGPFHSPLIKEAETWLQEEMTSFNFNQTQIPVVANVDAQPTTNIDKIKKNLAKQVTSPVLWVESVKYMISQDVKVFIEFGPKKVLKGMLRRIDRSAKVLNVEKIKDLKKIEKGLAKL